MLALCPCGSAIEFQKCCGRYLSSVETAPTAEALMRSRYVAFTLNDMGYISRTWHPDTRPANEESPSESIKWLKLDVLATNAGGVGNNEGTVEFVAHYLANGNEGRIHEVSRFIKEKDLWYYVDGDFVDQAITNPQIAKVGRNDLCPCGSGKKHKKCCGK